jgi:hypothetical protein
MSIMELPFIEMYGLSISATEEADSLRMLLVGNADSRVKDHLHAYLQEIHATAQRARVASVLIDLRRLEFMNSACLKALVSWLAEVRGLERDRRYSVCFLSNSDIHWQRRSLHALQCFAAELVQVQS